MPQRLVALADSPFPSLDPARAVLSSIGAELCLAEQPTPEGILRVARDADALMVTYAKITAEMIREMKRCQIISRVGIGTDNIDIAAATDAGVVVTKVPDYCVDEVSDHTLALLLALVRKIPQANSRTHAGRWELSSLTPIHRLRGTVLGLMGFGRIPQLVAPKAKAFGVRVMVHDPYVSRETLTRAGAESASFGELLKISDYVSIHSPLTPETQGLFNAGAFRQMKATAYLINTARGPIIDEAALASALDAGQLAGAALDVLSQEPPSNSPLFGRDNVILTPHMSYYSVESLVELQTRAAEEVVRALSGQAVRNPVNPEVLQRTNRSS
ncbi:MAG: C-terminal binding protein [Terriglobia bacterium]